jgi:hypothetical protein
MQWWLNKMTPYSQWMAQVNVKITQPDDIDYDIEAIRDLLGGG